MQLISVVLVIDFSFSQLLLALVFSLKQFQLIRYS